MEVDLPIEQNSHLAKVTDGGVFKNDLANVLQNVVASVGENEEKAKEEPRPAPASANANAGLGEITEDGEDES